MITTGIYSDSKFAEFSVEYQWSRTFFYFQVIGQIHGFIVEKTEVHYAPGSVGVADQVARHLTSNAQLVLDPGLATGRVVLVSGKDFTTVMKRPADRPATPVTEPPLSSATTTTTAPDKASSTTSSAKAPTTTAKSSKSTTTTTAVSGLNNTGTDVVGVVPGQPPAGTLCE